MPQICINIRHDQLYSIYFCIHHTFIHTQGYMVVYQVI